MIFKQRATLGWLASSGATCFLYVAFREARLLTLLLLLLALSITMVNFTRPSIVRKSCWYFFFYWMSNFWCMAITFLARNWYFLIIWLWEPGKPCWFENWVISACTHFSTKIIYSLKADPIFNSDKLKNMRYPQIIAHLLKKYKQNYKPVQLFEYIFSARILFTFKNTYLIFGFFCKKIPMCL